MKKVYVLNACILMIIFLTAGIIAKPEEDSHVIKNLIGERVDILNDYYSGKVDFDQTRGNLEEVENGTILRTDIEEMKKNAATDMSIVRDYNILINSIETTSYNITKGYVEIAWVMESYEGIERMKGEYFFVGENNNGKVKLTQFEKN